LKFVLKNPKCAPYPLLEDLLYQEYLQDDLLHRNICKSCILENYWKAVQKSAAGHASKSGKFVVPSGKAFAISTSFLAEISFQTGQQGRESFH